MDLTLDILFTGFAFAAVLYLISVGLSITMGMLGVINLAHGTFAVAGGYLAWLFIHRFGLSFYSSVAVAVVLVGLASVVLEKLLFARVYEAGELAQVLLTIGIVFISIAVAHFFFGSQPLTISPPDSLKGNIYFHGNSFAIYRIALIILGLLIYLLLWLGIDRTEVGARIRAVVDNRAMAENCGINSRRLFTVVFACGGGVAALGGAVGSSILGLSPSYPLEYLVYFLIVVSIGGMGTVSGTALAALLLGFGDTLCKVLLPQFGVFFIYIATIVILFIRPHGLFNRKM